MCQWNNTLWETRNRYWSIEFALPKDQERYDSMTNFWIKKNDILRLFEYSQLSQSTACCQKSKCDRNVTLSILLKEIFFYHYRCKDMVPLFGRNPTKHRLIFTLDFIYQHHHYRLESWNLYLLQPPYLQICRCSSWRGWTFK